MFDEGCYCYRHEGRFKTSISSTVGDQVKMEVSLCVHLKESLAMARGEEGRIFSTPLPPEKKGTRSVKLTNLGPATTGKNNPAVSKATVVPVLEVHEVQT